MVVVQPSAAPRLCGWHNGPTGSPRARPALWFDAGRAGVGVVAPGWLRQGVFRLRYSGEPEHRGESALDDRAGGLVAQRVGVVPACPDCGPRGDGLGASLSVKG